MRFSAIVGAFGLGLMVNLLCATSLAATKVDVTTAKFQGRSYVASGVPQRAVGIVLIGGSEGQLLLADVVAPRMAAMGYAVLGVNYHGGFADRSRPLANVPLEQFTAAVEWMQQQPGVRRVVVVGESRGSEAALLTALRSSRIAGVIGVAPSVYVWSAVGNADVDGPSGWAEAGRPLPYIRPIKAQQSDASTFNRAIAAMRETNSAPELETATIPIERIRVPILLIGGDDDAVWPSGDFVRAAQDRIRRLGSAGVLDARIYPHAGHRLLGVGSSSPTESYAWGGGVFVSRYGGTELGNARARASAWKEIANFLRNIEVRK
jgi:uncharacterized protein